MFIIIWSQDNLGTRFHMVPNERWVNGDRVQQVAEGYVNRWGQEKDDGGSLVAFN